MRKRLLVTIAGATLIASGGLAVAQRMDNAPAGASGAGGSAQHEPGGAAHERQPGAMQGQAQGRSGAVEEKGQRSGQSGPMQGQAQGRSGAVEEKEHRSGQSGPIQGQAQGRSGAGEEKGQRSGPSGVTQGPAREQSRGGVTEQRSVSTKLSQDQTTRIHETITSGDFRRVDHVDFSLSIGIRVPNTVTYYEIPETIVYIVPQYRGFKYIVVGHKLVIIDPDTLEIVAVLRT